MRANGGRQSIEYISRPEVLKLSIFPYEKNPPSYPSTQLIQPLQSACEDISFEPAVGLGNPLYEFSALSLLFSNEKEVYKTWASLLGKSAPSYLRADGLLFFLSVNLLGLILFHSYLPEE